MIRKNLKTPIALVCGGLLLGGTAVLATPGLLAVGTKLAVVTIATEFKIKQKGPSDLVFSTVTFQPGGNTGWHRHAGPHFVSVKTGSVTIFHSPDCIPEVFPAGTGFVDEGDDDIHIGVADATVPTTIFVLDNPQPGQNNRIDVPAPVGAANCGH